MASLRSLQWPLRANRTSFGCWSRLPFLVTGCDRLGPSPSVTGRLSHSLWNGVGAGTNRVKNGPGSAIRTLLQGSTEGPAGGGGGASEVRATVILPESLIRITPGLWWDHHLPAPSHQSGSSAPPPPPDAPGSTTYPGWRGTSAEWRSSVYDAGSSCRRCSMPSGRQLPSECKSHQWPPAWYSTHGCWNTLKNITKLWNFIREINV